MKKLSEVDMMDYLDGSLDAARLAQVEEHLRSHAEDAQLLAQIRLAQETVRDWHEAEPVRVSEDFWPTLRDRLPPPPGRHWLRGAGAQVGSWLWPSQSPLRLSMRVALVAGFLALAASFMGPKEAVHTAISSDEMQFIQQSLDRHAAYDSSQPLSGSAPLPVGDLHSADSGDTADDNEDNMP